MKVEGKINIQKLDSILGMVIITLAIVSVLFLVYSFLYQNTSIDKDIDFCFNFDPQVTERWRQCMVDRGNINSNISVARFAAFLSAVVLPAYYFGKTFLRKRFLTTASKNQTLY